MVVPTVSNAKNRMRRVITAIVDPWPKDEQPVWDHFSSRCAYCGVDLDRKGRKAHMDHATTDGDNHLGNLILSCATCNGDEKLGERWQGFLARKVPDPELRAARSRRIEEWMTLHPAIPQLRRKSTRSYGEVVPFAVEPRGGDPGVISERLRA